MALNISGVTASVVTAAQTQYARAVDAVDYTKRMADKAETLLDEATEAMRTARPVLKAMNEAVEAGLIDDIRSTVKQLDATAARVNRVSAQIDQTMPLFEATVSHVGKTLPLVDRTAKAVQGTVPVVTNLPTMQSDIRVAREATERLVGLLNTALSQLDSLPGARLVRRVSHLPGDEEAPPGSRP